MKNKLVLLLSLAVVLFGFVGGSQSAQATENNAGGQVTVDGNITFYAESSEPVELPDTGGKLPQTGEMIRNYSLLGGGVLLMAILFFLYRRKREKGGQA